ncbi:Dolichyl pyrophosphate phosphatase [Handroanthus impetiginosus]|uniref:Dolichyl pyrophosphate phosphatase n=1 Tax=Handroanthus impetiginosus TaxID=429701 RepID=A0A2G9HER6_9LAMI|nr:Dolichyl pyrophosphate phosphatase [Handroanthus impetiginosus]
MSAISIRPVTAATSGVPQSRKLQRPSNIFAKRLDFCGDLDCRKSFTWISRRRNQNTVMGSNGVRANRNDDGGVRAFEQEALVEGSLTFADGGLEAILNSLSKWFVAVLFSALILLRHDAEALWAAMGAVLNAILSIALKKVLNQERPTSTLRSDPGMPSSHAQSIFYTIAFLNLSIVEWYAMNILTTTLSGFFFILGSYFSWLRVSQKLHTLGQVIVGAVIGTLFSIFWFWSWNSFVLNLFMSYLWVRIAVILGAVGFCVGFLRHVYQTWIVDER